jgi:pimeloyl-[acyl-carrier protein] synthase
VTTGAPSGRSPIVPPELDAELASTGFIADPYPTYRRLREHASVAWSETHGSWMLTRYDDIMLALRDPRMSNAGRMRALLEPLAKDDPWSANLVADHYDHTLPFMNPPQHTGIKTRLQKPFTMKSVTALRPSIEALVDDLLDEIGGGSHDLMTQFATLLPVNVIGMMLGVPAADRAQFRPWTNRIFAIFSAGRPTRETVRAGAQSLFEMRTYLLGLIDERRREPRGDLVSELIRMSQDDGSPLTEEVVLANCVTLYTAGHETTSGFIGNAFLALFRAPQQLRLLRDEPDRIPDAVEELLRYDVSVQKAWRLAIADVEISGVTIAAGDRVSAMTAAANRDPEHFEDPDRLDISRKIDRHLAFGHGTHFCLGAMLARSETEVAIAAYLRRFPSARHDEDRLVWGPDVSFRSLLSLPVRVE